MSAGNGAQATMTSRRGFCLALGAVLLGACAEQTPPSPASAGRAGGEAAGRLGRLRLARVPAEADQTTLMRLLFPEGAPADAVEAHRALARRVDEDWQAGRVEWVDAWLLSTTEARIAAYQALSGGLAPRRGDST